MFERLAVAALAVMAWFFANEIGGNGFIAAFVGGGAAGMAARPVRDRVLEFIEDDGELLNVAVFSIVGVFAADALADATWRMVAYGVLSLTIIRMLPWPWRSSASACGRRPSRSSAGSGRAVSPRSSSPSSSSTNSPGSPA